MERPKGRLKQIRGDVDIHHCSHSSTIREGAGARGTVRSAHDVGPSGAGPGPNAVRPYVASAALPATPADAPQTPVEPLASVSAFLMVGPCIYYFPPLRGNESCHWAAHRTKAHVRTALAKATRFGNPFVRSSEWDLVRVILPIIGRGDAVVIKDLCELRLSETLGRTAQAANDGRLGAG